MLERLVAGIVIIGALLWGASLLATPEDRAQESLDAPDEPGDRPSERLPRVDEPAPAAQTEDGDDENEEKDDDDRSGSDRGPG